METKFKITRNHISILGGFCFILFALVTLFSSNTPFAFLSNLITHTFGFVGFWLVLPYLIILGIYLIMERRIFKIRLGVELWGIFVIIICFIILSSHWASIGTVVNGVELTGQNVTTDVGRPKYLTFSTSMTCFDIILESFSNKVGPTPKLGGGKIGFVLAGALNSAISPVGLNFVCWVLFLGGLVMIFHKQLRKFFKYIRKEVNAHKKNGFREVEIGTGEVDVVETLKVEEAKPEETVETLNENKPIFDPFNIRPQISNSYELKKARLVLSDDGSNVLDEVEEAPMKASFAPDNSIFEEKNSNDSSISFEPEEPAKEYSEPFFEPLADQEDKTEEVSEEFTSEEIPLEEPEEVDFEHKPQPKAKPVKNYIYPSIDLLDKNENSDDGSSNEESCQARTEIINRTLANLHIGAQVVSHTVGPSVTRYDLQTNDDVSITAVQRYIGDISVRLNGIPVRFEPIVAGKSTSGLEIPNEVRENVTLREAIEGLPKGEKYRLNIPFGKSISGELKYANLADFPHLLVAGTTGSGKSIFVHATILSLLMRNRPEELKLVMVDPKKVEMNYYDDIPHLLCPVISDVQKVMVCFNKLVAEMERRYNLFKDNRVRDIKGFNEFAKMKGLQPLPYIVVFIDEYADLVETCKDIRTPVVRIVQKARAAGIHMVFATQRPSVNVIDGVIKANVATRVALMCASQTDSLTVIGEGGAEKLLGYGDMLIECSLLSRSIKPRVQGCYVSETEIMRVCDFLREHYQPQFDPMFLNLEPVVEEKRFEEPEVAKIDKSQTDEEAYQRIKEDARHREYFSISYITRTYGMGYSRAGKMFVRLQREGIVAPEGDARGCKVLVYTPGESFATSVEQSTFIPDDEESN